MKKILFPILFIGLALLLSGFSYLMLRKQPESKPRVPTLIQEETESEIIIGKDYPAITEPTLPMPSQGKIEPVIITDKDDQETAKNTLIAFFDLLSKKEYGKAATLFADSQLESITVYSPEEYRTDEAAVLGQYCTACQTCNKVKVLSSEFIRDGLYSFKVRFFLPDGSIYIFGPCCGASEEEIPSRSEFDYTVEKINGIFQVTRPPLYRP